MSKKKNYTNYYSKSTYEKRDELDNKQEDVVRYSDNKQEAVLRYFDEDEKPQVDVVQEEVEETEPKKSPEGNFEKTESKKEFPPRQADLIENLYIRESIDGPKVLKEDLDLIISSKVIKDRKGHAIVPKGTRVEVFDCTETENGTLWYSTRFGYLMAKTKSGKEYIKAVR